MGSVTEVDYLTQARSRYTQQFKNKPIFDAHIKIFIDEILELQDTFQDLIGLRSLETAVGTQLDMIGAIVGQPRVLVDFSLFPFFGFDGASEAQTFGSLYDAALGGTWRSISDSEGASFEVDDDTYRFIIKARIVANISNTTPQGVIDAINYIVGRNDSTIEELGNAHLKIIHSASLTSLQEYFLRGLSSIGSIIPLPICVSYEIECSLPRILNLPFSSSVIYDREGNTWENKYGNAVIADNAMYTGTSGIAGVFNSGSSLLAIGLADFEIGVTVKLDSIPSVGCVLFDCFRSTGLGGEGFQLYVYSGGAISFYQKNSPLNEVKSASSVITTGSYIEVKATRIAGVVRLYVNNTQVATGSMNIAFDSNWTAIGYQYLDNGNGYYPSRGYFRNAYARLL